MKKIICLILAMILTLSLAGCKKDTGMVGDSYLLTIYRARSSGMVDGVNDDKVTEALEKKFYKDTGIKVKLVMKMYTNTDLINQVDVNFSNRNQSMEAVIHYMSEDAGSAIIKYARDNNFAAKDLSSYLEQDGQNILAKIRENDDGHYAERAGYFNINGKYYHNVLTSHEKEGGFGILIRKDYMEKVKNITGLDPDDYDINNENCKHMTVEEFDNLMRVIKKNIAGIQYPVSGFAWDLARTIGTAFGVDGMNYGFNEEGKFVPTQFTANYDRYLNLMYQWNKDGIWEKDNISMTDELRRTNFISGLSATFMSYSIPEQIIMINRTFKQANPNGELMVLSPLAASDRDGNPILDKDGNRVVNGSLKTARAWMGMIVPYRAKNTEILIKFIDWMYSDVENYELAKYGIKGKDWIEGEDRVINGKTFKTWAYPEDKVDQYLNKPPYSGMWELLPNINVSDRICAHYNTEETNWYYNLYYNVPNFTTGTEGIWVPSLSRDLAVQASEIDGKYVESIRGKAWAGILGEGGKTPVEILSTYKEQCYKSFSSYFEFLNESYNNSLQYFAQKFGD